jgi:hypothetical protein
LIDPQKDLISSFAINVADITRNPNFADSDAWMVMREIFIHVAAPQCRFPSGDDANITKVTLI